MPTSFLIKKRDFIELDYLFYTSFFGGDIQKPRNCANLKYPSNFRKFKYFTDPTLKIGFKNRIMWVFM